MHKKLIAVCAALLLTLLFSGCTVFTSYAAVSPLAEEQVILKEEMPAPADGDTVEVDLGELTPEDEYSYDPLEDMFDNTSAVIGYVLIVVLGYVMPLILIAVSLLRYFKSTHSRRGCWFIMTGVALATSLLTTLFLLVTM